MKTLPLTLLLMTTVACQVQEEDSLTSSSSESEKISEAVEAAVTSISGSLDEQSDEDFAQANTNLMDKLFTDKAYAANCFGRAVGQVCENGVKSIQYDDCTIGNSNHSLTGTVQLEYSQADCSMEEDGDSVTRTYHYTRTAPNGSQVNTNSDEKTLNGESIGGGATLTRTSDSSYEVEIKGKHKVKTRANGRRGFNISIRTLENLEVEGDLRRANRQVKDGTLQVIHNRLSYTTNITAQNLEYSSSCCYPVGGSMTLEYSGSIEGSGSVNLLSCGEAELTKGDEVYPIEFYSCE